MCTLSLECKVSVVVDCKVDRRNSEREKQISKFMNEWWNTSLFPHTSSQCPKESRVMDLEDLQYVVLKLKFLKNSFLVHKIHQIHFKPVFIAVWFDQLRWMLISGLYILLACGLPSLGIYRNGDTQLAEEKKQFFRDVFRYSHLKGTTSGKPCCV